MCYHTTVFFISFFFPKHSHLFFYFYFFYSRAHVFLGASNLPSKDSYGSYGLPDPYCVIRSTFSSHLVGKTKVIKNSVNPRWDESFTFTVKQSSAKGDFHAIFFDKQAIGKFSLLALIIEFNVYVVVLFDLIQLLSVC